MEYGFLFVALACVFGLFMAWGVGANDVANAMSTSVGSRAITVKHAIIIAAIFEFAGAYLAGGEVTATIRNGMIDTTSIVDQPEILVFGMLASLLAAGTWLLVASIFGWPVSTTHSIVGAIVGFGAVGIGIDAVYWSRIGTIMSSWIISPVLAGVMAYGLFMSVQALILNTETPLKNALRYVPGYIFLTVFITAAVTFTKGLSHVGLGLSGVQAYLLSAAVAAAAAAGGGMFIRRLKLDPAADHRFQFANVERVFTLLMIITACAMAFAHGSNDVANAVGPVAAIVGIVESGTIAASSMVPPGGRGARGWTGARHRRTQPVGNPQHLRLVDHHPAGGRHPLHPVFLHPPRPAFLSHEQTDRLRRWTAAHSARGSAMPGGRPVSGSCRTGG